LAPTTDEEHELHPFVDVQSRKRRRNRTSPPQQSQQQRSLTSRDNAQPQQQQQQSRRRHCDAPGDPTVDRRAFRLCIYYDDRKRLLDASIWPDSVLIYEWFFKSQQSSVTDQSKRQCLDVNAISRHDTAAAAG